MTGDRRVFIVWLVVAALFVCFAVPLFEIGVRNLWDYGVLLDRDPATTTARVTDRQHVTSSGGRFGHSESYEVQYAFRVPGEDRTFRATSRSVFEHDRNTFVPVPKRLYDHALVHDDIKVRYLQDDPSINEPVEAPRGSWTALLFVLLAFGFAGFAALFVWRGMQAMWPTRWPRRPRR